MLVVAGCATGGAGEDLLARTELHQRVGPEWHLRSIAIVPASDQEKGRCRADSRPQRTELVYARADGSQPQRVSAVQCVFRYTHASVWVREEPAGTLIAGIRPRPEVHPAPPGSAAPSDGSGLVPARAVTTVPAEIPRSLQVSERGRRYQISVCTNVEGSVDSVRLVADQHHPEIDARVLDAVSRWKYQPATFNGHPVPSCSWTVMKL